MNAEKCCKHHISKLSFQTDCFNDYRRVNKYSHIRFNNCTDWFNNECYVFPFPEVTIRWCQVVIYRALVFYSLCQIFMISFFKYDLSIFFITHCINILTYFSVWLHYYLATKIVKSEMYMPVINPYIHVLKCIHSYMRKPSIHTSVRDTYIFVNGLFTTFLVNEWSIHSAV